MHEVSTLFFDVGGVILTNAWDTAARNRVDRGVRPGRRRFPYPARDGQDGVRDRPAEPGLLHPEDRLPRRAAVLAATTSGRSCSSSRSSWARPSSGSGRWRRPAGSGCSRSTTSRASCTSTGSRTFGLCSVFQSFLTSCYLGQVKPDEDLYRNALGIAGCRAGEGIFVDDRPVNVETALMLGLGRSGSRASTSFVRPWRASGSRGMNRQGPDPSPSPHEIPHAARTSPPQARGPDTRPRP